MQKKTINLFQVIFWVVMPCSVVVGYQCSRGPCCCHLQDETDGGSMDLWNVGILLQCYMASQPRRHQLKTLLPWKPQSLLTHSFYSSAHVFVPYEEYSKPVLKTIIYCNHETGVTLLFRKLTI